MKTDDRRTAREQAPYDRMATTHTAIPRTRERHRSVFTNSPYGHKAPHWTVKITWQVSPHSGVASAASREFVEHRRTTQATREHLGVRILVASEVSIICNR